MSHVFLISTESNRVIFFKVGPISCPWKRNTNQNTLNCLTFDTSFARSSYKRMEPRGDVNWRKLRQDKRRKENDEDRSNIYLITSSKNISLPRVSIVSPRYSPAVARTSSHKFLIKYRLLTSLAWTNSTSYLPGINFRSGRLRHEDVRRKQTCCLYVCGSVQWRSARVARGSPFALKYCLVLREMDVYLKSGRRRYATVLHLLSGHNKHCPLLCYAKSVWKLHVTRWAHADPLKMS